jgi:hypothetical protein
MKNLGTIDRIVRVILALVIVGLYFAGMLSGTLAIVLLVMAGVFIITSLISTCPLYLPFGIKTCKVEKK